LDGAKEKSLTKTTDQLSVPDCNHTTNISQQTEHESKMNKAEIIAELENMVVTRLFSHEPWLADRETVSAVYRKLIQMGLLEQTCAEPETWRISPLGKELDVDLFQVFMGVHYEGEVPMILEEYDLLNESETDEIYERLSEPQTNAERLLSGYVKRAYFDYRKAAKFLH